MSEQGQLYWYKAKLVRIIDGDTIVLNIDLGCNQWIHDEHVRLAGIDTPEVRGDEKIRGVEALEYLACLLPSVGGELLIRTTKDKRGSFHRLLADVYVDGMHVNERMVTEGFAEERHVE